MNRIITLLIPITILSIISSFGEIEIHDIQKNKTNQLKKKENKLERYYEAIIDNVIAKYYSKNSFITNVKVSLEEKIVTTKLPVDNRVLLDGEISELPGLPFLPDELRVNGNLDNDKGYLSRLIKDYSIENVHVNLLVDTMYSPNDFKFLNESIKLVAHLDFTRGDKVSINKALFPKKQDEWDTQISMLEKVKDTVFMTQKQDEKEQSSLNNSMLIIFGIISLFILLLIIIAIELMRKKPKKEQEADPRINQILSEIKSLNIAQNPKDEKIKSEIDDTAIRSLGFNVIYKCIGNPQKAAQTISSWIENDEDQGAHKAAKLILTTDDKLLDIIKSFLRRDQFELIKLLKEKTDKISDQEKIDLLNLFRKDFQNLLAKYAKTNENADMFSFIRQLNSSQILHLMKDESEGIQALILAQLKPDIAVEILRKFDPALRQKVLVDMGNITNIPLSAYKDLAANLSTKALEVVNLKYVEADGLDNILAIIPEMQTDEQPEVISGIASMDLDLANKVRKYYASFQEIPSLDENFLRAIINDFDRDTLAVALTNAPEDIYNHIMQLLPDRMQQMIYSIMETKVDSSNEEIEKARDKLIRYVMQNLKKTGGREV